METQLASKMSCFFKQLYDGQSPNKEARQLTSVVLCSILDILTLEDGSAKLSLDVSKKLPFYAPQCSRRMHISHDDLAMQALVWLCMVQFRVIQFGAARFCASHTNLRQPYISKHQI